MSAIRCMFYQAVSRGRRVSKMCPERRAKNVFGSFTGPVGKVTGGAGRPLETLFSRIREPGFQELPTHFVRQMRYTVAWPSVPIFATVSGKRITNHRR